jgi:hypothetical protein
MGNLERAIDLAEVRQPTRETAGVGCRHNFVRDEDHGGECCQKCGKVRIRQPAALSAKCWAELQSAGHVAGVES